MSDEPDATAEGGARASTVTVTTRPLLTPESFSGKGSFSEWLQHFEGVAAINKWDDAAKLLWLRIRLVGSFQEHLYNLRKVFERLREAGLTLKPTKCFFFFRLRCSISDTSSPEREFPQILPKLARWWDDPPPSQRKMFNSFSGLQGITGGLFEISPQLQNHSIASQKKQPNSNGQQSAMRHFKPCISGFAQHPSWHFQISTSHLFWTLMRTTQE